MKKLDKFRSKLKELPDKIDGFFQDAFNEFDSEAEDFNIQQLESGERADGTKLPDYSPVSVAVYGKPAGPIMLKDTGAFHRSIQLKANKKEASLTATDPKTEMLKDNYGDEIIGLTNENAEMLKNDYIGPAIKDYIANFINGRNS